MAPAPAVREKAAAVVCLLVESGRCDSLLVSEGTLEPLIRLSASPDVTRAIVGHGGACPLIEICQTGDSVSQSVAAGALKNLSTVPEAVHALADEGIVRVMVTLLDNDIVLSFKEHAADCLQNVTSSSDNFRLAVASDSGLCSLLLYLDAPSPQESMVRPLENIVFAVRALANTAGPRAQNRVEQRAAGHGIGIVQDLWKCRVSEMDLKGLFASFHLQRLSLVDPTADVATTWHRSTRCIAI